MSHVPAHASLRPLGAHMSVAGSFLTAVTETVTAGADALQIFTKSQLRWHAPPIADRAACEFRAAVQAAGIRFLSAHDSYLINLAAGSEDTWAKSVTSLTLELERAAQLGVCCVVLHPGSPKTDGAEVGIQRIVKGLREVLRSTAGNPVRIALENTAGQGATLGVTVQELTAMIAGCDGDPRLGLCLDTCHAFAAGYDLRTPAAVAALVDAIAAGPGLDRLLLLHLNDSKKACGLHLDRHEPIGAGCIGELGFRCLLAEPRLKGIPGILETPKSDDPAMTDDRRNLATIRRCEAAGLPT
ncbi:MAG: deoxyribonuclease IV [bacterium]